MMFKVSAAWLSVLVLFVHVSAAASDSLLEYTDVSALLKQEQVVFLDVQEEPAFVQHHLPGAVNIPYSRWRTSGDAPSAKNLPAVDVLESLLGNAGIANDDHVVVVATGLQPGDLSAMARVFWTLKTLGHDRVSVLNGGLADYARNRVGPLARGREAKREATTYKASPSLALLAKADDLSGAKTIDARSPAEFLGLVSGGGREREGTVPGSVNVNFSWLAADGGGRLRSAKALKTLFAKAGVPDADAQIHFCHTGNRAALTWFVDYAVLGHKNARLYDASMLEWAADSKRPMELKWSLDD